MTFGEIALVRLTQKQHSIILSSLPAEHFRAFTNEQCCRRYSEFVPPFCAIARESQMIECIIFKDRAFVWNAPRFAPNDRMDGKRQLSIPGKLLGLLQREECCRMVMNERVSALLCCAVRCGRKRYCCLKQTN
jgi:hypothetical protein